MARNENPPFDRGATWYGGATPDANDLGGANILGMEWVFEDVNPDTGVKRSEHPVRCRAVRNVSGINLLPAKLVRLGVTEGNYGTEVLAYTNTTAGEGYPTDEWLPAAGVVDDDIFWIVIEGPAEITVSTTAANIAALDAGGWCVAETSANSTNTTDMSTANAGRVRTQILTGASSTLADNIQNRVGRALTSTSTAHTNSDRVFYVGKW